MVRKLFSILAVIVGLPLMVWGFYGWYVDGFPLDNLLPYRNLGTFNVVHYAYIGIALISYGVFDLWLGKNQNG